MTPTVSTPASTDPVDYSGYTVSQLQNLIAGTEATPLPVVTETVADAPTQGDEKPEETKTSEIAEESEKTPAVEIPAPESETGSKDKEEPAHGDPTSKRGIERRFKKLTNEISDLKEQLARQPAAAVPEKPGVASPGVTTAPVVPANKPKLDDFADYEAFNEALMDWKVDQREQAKEQKAAAAKAEEGLKSQQSEWQAKIAKAKQDDWEEVVSAAALPMSPPIREAIVTSDHGADIAYHLAKHPDEAQALSTMTPVAAVRAIGKLEAKFSQPVAEPSKPKAQPVLPKPPANVGGKSAASVPDINDPNLSIAEVKRLANTMLSPRNRF